MRNTSEQLAKLRKANHALRLKLESRVTDAATAGRHYSAGSDITLLLRVCETLLRWRIACTRQLY